MGEFEFNAGRSLMNPLTLFMQADFVVKLVMIGLLMASIWTWAIIISHSRKIGRMRKRASGSNAISGGPGISIVFTMRGAATIIPPPGFSARVFPNGGARSQTAQSTGPARASGWRRPWALRSLPKWTS